MKAKPQKPFLWIPGEGCDDAALARLQRAFPPPRAPMGEAWFMGETRRMYGERTASGVWLSHREVREALFEIASGTRSFGERPEWTEWLHFLLAEELPAAMHGSFESPLVEKLVTAVAALYPLGFQREPYRGFGRDVLDTLGRSIMNADCWANGRIVRGEILHRRQTPWGTWGWDGASGDLSASMFFCLKYLTSAEIGPWMRSALSIEDRYWRAQIMVFLVGAHGVLTGDIRQPCEFSDDMRPDVAWEDSHLLNGAYYDVTTQEAGAPFLPEANCREALAAVAACFDDATYLDWLCAFCEDAELEAELAELPEAFRALYLPMA